MQTRHINLLFQGGGVKGIAYAGVLAEVPRDYQIEAVAGTSAGAIAAAFVALGYPADELRELLSEERLFGLLSQTERDRTQRIEQAGTDILQILNAAGAEPKLSIWQLVKLASKHKRVIKDLAAVWRERGLHSTSDLRDWLDSHLRIREGDRKGQRAYFEDIVVDDLKIVVADVTNRQFKVFERRRHVGSLIADAVHASISIPVFFMPFLAAAGTESFVDGGILSNYPSFLFAQSEYKTIGFRFSDMKRPGQQLKSTMDYLTGLVFTMTDAHDKLRGDPPRFISYEIPTSIPATKFHLSRAEADELYKAGRDVAKTVDWNAHSSDRPEIAFYDERPHDVLQSSLTQAFNLMDKYGKDKSFWVESMESDVTYSVRIERDWTVRYEIRETFSVGGTTPLFFSRLRANWSRELPFGKSLADLQYSIREVRNGTETEVIHIPALNKEASKGFLIFFTPPITNGGARHFRTGFSVPREFAKTLAKGKSDTLSFAVLQNSPQHFLTLKFQVWADTDLPHLSYRPGRSLKQASKVELEHQPADVRDGRKYLGWEWGIPRAPVVSDVGFEVEVNLG
jgi:NTE family protein